MTRDASIVYTIAKIWFGMKSEKNMQAARSIEDYERA